MFRHRRCSVMLPLVVVVGWGLPEPTPAWAQGKPSLGRQRVKRPEPPKDQDVPDKYKDVPEVLRFEMRDIDGNMVELKEFQGNVIMMVNTASKCGYTPQYAELQQLYEKYKDQGFVILAFPSNDYNEQEPGDAAEIKKFCTDNYKVAFKLFDKVQVKDPNNACELYKHLADKKKNTHFGGEIKWNFTKFLIDRKGEIRARFEPAVKPTDKKVIARLESLLKVKVPKKKTDDETKPDAPKREDKEKRPPNA